MRILIVEDSTALRETLATAFRRTGWATDACADGEEGLWRAQSEEYDVIVLDIMLPKIDGLEVLRRLRTEGVRTPVLLLTARTAVPDRVHGLNTGADDYLVKPFALDELLARVQALARRHHGQADVCIEVGGVVINTAARSVLCGDRAIDLAPKEYALLEYLALHPGQVVTRAEIERHIYDERVEPMSNVVDKGLCTLRRKLEEAGVPPLIHTRRGHGYILAAGEYA
jgi:DNA-binding response OmpR family regulator